MIAVETRGRMGNQMFQLAFAHVAARRLGTTFILGPDELASGFRVGAWGRLATRVARKAVFRLRYEGRVPRVDVGDDDDPDDVLRNLQDRTTYGGFFQSARYFEGYEAEVRALFSVREEHLNAFRRIYGDVGEYTCVHVRRGDYLDWGPGRALPSSYFRDALTQMPEQPVVVISDDLESARRELGDLRDVRFEENDAMIDFLLLTNATAVVTSNSSFSWWGAWLNDRPGVRVAAPDGWLGFAEGREIPRAVIPPTWVRVPVRDDPFRALAQAPA